MDTLQSPLAREFNKKVQIERLSEVAGTEKEQYLSHISDVECFIHPSDESFNEDMTGSFGKDYLMFCEVLDIKEGDKIIDGVTEYRVIGVENYPEFIDSAQHLEVIIRKFKQ